MYLVVLAGGIASGKSTVARELARRGALRLDLDALSREATCAGSVTNQRLSRVFGTDIIDEKTNELRRDVLASRAFVSAARTRELEQIVHPAVLDLMDERLEQAKDYDVCVVEVPLLDRVEGLCRRADEVLCVICPLDIRRRRAVARGMDEADFTARVARQPSDDYLEAHATTVLKNDADEDALMRRIDAWWNAHQTDDWGRG